MRRVDTAQGFNRGSAWGVAAGALALLVGCAEPKAAGGGAADTMDSGARVVPQEPGTFRVAMVADTHVIGPEYVCCSESEGIDNESIMKTPERLAAVVAAINAVEPPPELVFVLGDVVHDTLVLVCTVAPGGHAPLPRGAYPPLDRPARDRAVPPHGARGDPLRRRQLLAV